MERPDTACAQRVDLLDYVRQEAGDEKTAYPAGTHGAYGRKAPAMLLARLPASLAEYCKASVFCYSLRNKSNLVDLTSIIN
jgi:hypothetical protein